MKFKKNNLRRLFVISLTISLLVACNSITIISNYDEVTDKYLTTLQQSVSIFIDSLEQFSGTDTAAFAKHQKTYDMLDNQIKILEFRVAAIPKNDQTIIIVKTIRLTILGNEDTSQPKTGLKDLHCLNDHNKSYGPSKAVLEVCRRNINQTISAALTLELAKKTGKSPQ
ncbi:MAG: hypothetical protein NTX65_04985 [Ignavibacteriales bacterium]|nr:hypothetical protein [Ignavibacteriales bacterium]